MVVVVVVVFVVVVVVVVEGQDMFKACSAKEYREHLCILFF